MKMMMLFSKAILVEAYSLSIWQNLKQRIDLNNLKLLFTEYLKKMQMLIDLEEKMKYPQQ